MRSALVAFGVGAAVFGFAAAHGHAWELAWLPAVMLGVAWPTSTGVSIRSCLRRLRRRREKQA